MEYAGAEFALRVYAGLSRLGFKFKESHPSPDQRLKNLRRHARLLCISHRDFIRLTTIAFSNDQLLEAVERQLPERIAGPWAVGPTAERTLSSLSVLVEECAKRKITRNS
jgi:hypothetical protein